MEIIKGSTAKGQRVIAMYDHNEGYDLDDVYGRYSRAKKNAYDECYEWYRQDNKSSNFHIGSHNAQAFTVAWRYVDPETGHVIYRVETNRNTYRVDTEV